MKKKNENKIRSKNVFNHLYVNLTNRVGNKNKWNNILKSEREEREKKRTQNPLYYKK